VRRAEAAQALAQQVVDGIDQFLHGFLQIVVT
jgi:hypothetical protein